MQKQKFVWNTTWLTLKPFLTVFCRFEKIGLENIRNVQGPCILAIATHSYGFDPYIVGTAMPFNSNLFPIRFMAKERFFKMPVVKNIIEAYGTFPVIQGIGLENSLKPAIELLKNNVAIGMFVEGKVAKNGELREFKPGAAALSIMTGTPIIPVALKGTWQIRNPLKFLFLQKKISVSFGQPIQHDFTCTPGTTIQDNREVVEKLTGRISEEIKKLYYSC
jgi:1-acyl-sn-glycerol-3-phosphate acyltransferase